jgi:hypothetical protein
MLFTGIAAVSFCNGADSVYPQFCPQQVAPAQELSAQLQAGANADATPTALTASISVANGPAATSIRPVRLSRTPGTSYTLTIRGANLIGATEVTFVGIWNSDVVSGSPVVSADGRTLTVDMFVSPNAPLGAVNVVVGGPGWRTAEVPGMRVEIVR